MAIKASLVAEKDIVEYTYDCSSDKDEIIIGASPAVTCLANMRSLLYMFVKYSHKEDISYIMYIKVEIRAYTTFNAKCYI